MAEFTKGLRFLRSGKKSFNRVINARVRSYFEENKLSPKASVAMVIKTIVMALVYFSPLLTIVVFDTNAITTQLLFVVMGVGMAGIGMNVMHDANHGAYSKNEWVNKIIGSSIYLISGNVATWKVQHNILHHTFTNVEGHDEDIDTNSLLRLHPSQNWKSVFRYQAWYVPFLYGLGTLNRAIFKDFNQLLNYKRQEIGGGHKLSIRREWLILVISKVVYFSIFLITPIVLSSIHWYWTLLGFVLMHLTAGMILSFTFQLAHVVEEVDKLPAPLEGKIQKEWMEHQIRTTANFSPNSKWLNWYVGGLNHQIEHHLFPNICHVHYPAIAKIVKKTAKEFDLPYHEQPNFFRAIGSHFKLLSKLGKQPLAIH